MDHTIDGRVIFPATGYLCIVWKTLARALGLAVEQLPVVFEDVVLHQATILPKTGEGHPRTEARAAGGRCCPLISDSPALQGPCPWRYGSWRPPAPSRCHRMAT